MTDEEISTACNQEIQEVLKKHNCILVFEQLSRNGMPVDGRFRALPIPAIQPAAAMPNGSPPGRIKLV